MILLGLHRNGILGVERHNMRGELLHGTLQSLHVLELGAGQVGVCVLFVGVRWIRNNRHGYISRFGARGRSNSRTCLGDRLKKSRRQDLVYLSMRHVHFGIELTARQRSLANKTISGCTRNIDDSSLFSNIFNANCCCKRSDKAALTRWIQSSVEIPTHGWQSTRQDFHQGARRASILCHYMMARLASMISVG